MGEITKEGTIKAALEYLSPCGLKDCALAALEALVMEPQLTKLRADRDKWLRLLQERTLDKEAISDENEILHAALEAEIARTVLCQNSNADLKQAPDAVNQVLQLEINERDRCVKAVERLAPDLLINGSAGDFIEAACEKLRLTQLAAKRAETEHAWSEAAKHAE